MLTHFRCTYCGHFFWRDVYPSTPTPKYCDWGCSHADLGKKHRAPWLRRLNRSVGRNKEVARMNAHKIRANQPNLGKSNGKTYAKLHGRHEHRVVMEKILGRGLREDEVVHHRDGDKRNNHPRNLSLMTRSSHSRFHALKKHRYAK